jgi:hypothetical protein
LTLIQGGYNVYGRSIGILMLETRFPRLPGDLGNATTFPFPVVHRVVPGATPQRAVTAGDPTLLGPCISAAQELVAQGVRAITTNCGFLALFQRELAAAVEVPVVTSSLLLVPLLRQLLSARQRIGILTAEKSSLTERHFLAAGWSSNEIPVVVEGMDGRYFNDCFVADRPDFDLQLLERDLVEVAGSFVERHPDIGALVLECTNMVPFAQAIQDATARMTWDITLLLTGLQTSMHRQAYQGYLR